MVLSVVSVVGFVINDSGLNMIPDFNVCKALLCLDKMGCIRRNMRLIGDVSGWIGEWDISSIMSIDELKYIYIYIFFHTHFTLLLLNCTKDRKIFTTNHLPFNTTSLTIIPYLLPVDFISIWYHHLVLNQMMMMI